jgi:hypothetical protein
VPETSLTLELVEAVQGELLGAPPSAAASRAKIAATVRSGTNSLRGNNKDRMPTPLRRVIGLVTLAGGDVLRDFNRNERPHSFVSACGENASLPS